NTEFTPTDGTSVPCHHQGYFRASASGGFSCLVEGSSYDAAFRAFQLAQVETTASFAPDCTYFDTVPQNSNARFDASDPAAEQGYDNAVWDAERSYIAAASAKHGSVFKVAREHAPDYINAQAPAFINNSGVLFHATKNNVQRVPLGQLVYHDWIAGGSLLLSEAESAEAYQVKLARAVAHGYMPQVTANVTTSYDPTEATIGAANGNFENTLQGFATARRALKKYLVDGEMIAPVEYAASPASDLHAWTTPGWCNSAPRTPCGTFVTGKDAPAVQGGFWRAPDGTYALVYANAHQTVPKNAYIVPPPRFRNAVKQDCASGQAKGFCTPSATPFTVEATDRWRVVPGGRTVRITYLDEVP
ncbi:MAG TPA: hypothetical protein VM487_17120, partial [Phycisphaerae bacterium]|nr:hypothetical protein [Phycisphaerae bacterium]